MTLNRRVFLQAGSAAALLALLPRHAAAQERFLKEAGPWRRYEIITRIEVYKPEGNVQAWVPVPSVEDADWSKPAGSTWKTNAKLAKLRRAGASHATLVHLQWAEGEAAPYAEIASEVSTRDRVTDFSRPRKITPLTSEERAACTALLPNSGNDAAIRQTAARITDNAKTDLGKAKAIYEWLVAGNDCCGGKGSSKPRTGNIDINLRYVSLARAAGLAARPVFGLRVAPSHSGYTALGVDSGALTKAQHCHAEVWLEDYGWMPADPADFCKIVCEEPLAADPQRDAKIASARLTLFGAWEGNWVAYNMLTNVQLPGFEPMNGEQTPVKPPLMVPYLTHPYAETAAGLLDGSDHSRFNYTITAKEMPA